MTVVCVCAIGNSVAYQLVQHIAYVLCVAITGCCVHNLLSISVHRVFKLRCVPPLINLTEPS